MNSKGYPACQEFPELVMRAAAVDLTAWPHAGLVVEQLQYMSEPGSQQGWVPTTIVSKGSASPQPAVVFLHATGEHITSAIAPDAVQPTSSLARLLTWRCSIPLPMLPYTHAMAACQCTKGQKHHA